VLPEPYVAIKYVLVQGFSGNSNDDIEPSSLFNVIPIPNIIPFAKINNQNLGS